MFQFLPDIFSFILINSESGEEDCDKLVFLNPDIS